MTKQLDCARVLYLLTDAKNSIETADSHMAIHFLAEALAQLLEHVNLPIPPRLFFLDNRSR